MQDHIYCKKYKHLLSGNLPVTMISLSMKTCNFLSTLLERYFPFVKKGQTHYGQPDHNALALMLPLNKKTFFSPLYFTQFWSSNLLPLLQENSSQETNTNSYFMFLGKTKSHYWNMFLKNTQNIY